MIVGDQAQRAFLQSADERLAVCLAAQRRIHLPVGVDHIAVAQQQMMRGHFPADITAAAAVFAQQLDALLCGDMTAMIVCAGLLDQLQVALQLFPFAF